MRYILGSAKEANARDAVLCDEHPYGLLCTLRHDTVISALGLGGHGQV